MFGFFEWTTRMTIQSSKEVDGAVGMIAKACGSCCGTKWGQTTAAIVKVRVSQSVVVPISQAAAAAEPSEINRKNWTLVPNNRVAAEQEVNT
jgi:hypothetical protein